MLFRSDLPARIPAKAGGSVRTGSSRYDQVRLADEMLVERTLQLVQRRQARRAAGQLALDGTVELTAEKQWWKGTPVNPYPLLGD